MPCQRCGATGVMPILYAIFAKRVLGQLLLFRGTHYSPVETAYSSSWAWLSQDSLGACGHLHRCSA
eukprot:4656642-Pyramimonas_sp.AAC.1